MKEFRIKPNGFKEIQNKLLIRVLPLLILAGGVGITISTLNSKDEESGVNALPIVIPLMAAAVGVGLYRGAKKQKRLFDSYVLTLTNNMVMREQENTPPVALYHNDIKEIVKAKDGSFTIRGKDAVDVIYVPAQIDGYTDLEASLVAIQPIGSKSKQSPLGKYQSVLPFGTLALLLAVNTATNKVVVAITGTLLLALMIWSGYSIWRSRNIDSGTKRSMWWMVLVIGSTIFVMITKLSAPTLP